MANIATPMFQPRTERAVEYAQEVLERGRELALSQLDVIENMYGEVIGEYRELLTTTEPAELFRNWPKVFEFTVRNTTEATAAIVKNGMNFQNELMQLLQSRMPELQKDVDEMAEKTKAAGESVAATARVARQEAGRSQARTSRAA